MKKLVLVIFLLSSFLSLVKAAEPKIKWGTDQEFSKNCFIRKIGVDPNGYYVYRNTIAIGLSSEKCFIDRYNNDHKLEGSKELILKDAQKKPCWIKDIFFINGKALVFMQTDYTSANGTQLYVQALDQKLNAAELKELDAIKGKNNAEFREYFTLCASEDKTRIAICRRVSPKSINYKLLDESLQVIMEKEIEIAESEKSSYDVRQFEVDHDGVLTMLGYSIVGKRGTKYDMITFDPATSKLTKTALSHIHPGIFVMGPIDFVKYAVDPKNNKIYIAGYYCNVAKPQDSEWNPNIEGAYYARVDRQTGNLEAETTAPFTNAFLSGMPKYVTKQGGILGLYLDSIIVTSAGTVYLLGEIKFASVVTKSTIYTSYDILINSFAMNGNADWVARVHKGQRAEYENVSRHSFSVFSGKDDKLHFLYYDTPKNLLVDNNINTMDEANMDNRSKCVMVMATVNSQGKVERNVISDDIIEKKMAIDPSWSIISKPGEMLIHASDYSHNITRFGTLSLPE